jgi:hypothetical protein
MANQARSPEEKAMLANMAATWDLLAADRAAYIARQRRLADLENWTAAAIPIDRLNASNDD